MRRRHFWRCWGRVRTSHRRHAEESASQVPLQIVGAEAVREGRFARDAARAHLGQRLLHRHHALGAPHRNLRPQLMVVALADERAHGVGSDHDLEPPASGSRHPPPAPVAARPPPPAPATIAAGSAADYRQETNPECATSPEWRRWCAASRTPGARFRPPSGPSPWFRRRAFRPPGSRRASAA